MNKVDLEKYKKEKEEYDKKIRSLDYKIVETSVETYNLKSKNHQLKKDDEESKIIELENKIDSYELEKAKLTKEIWEKVVLIKTKLREVINSKIIENPSETDNYLSAMFTITKITDVYFNIEELIKLKYLFEDETNEKINNKEGYLGESLFKNSLENEFLNIKTVQTFNIEEQRVIDFENLLNHIEKVSKDYRRDVDMALSRFIENYNVVKNIEYVRNDFDNITNNYLEILKNIILNFKKDENVDEIKDRISKQKEKIKEIENKLINNSVELKDIQRKMQELAKIYFVGNYVKKIENQVAKIQGDIGIYSKEQIKANSIFMQQKDTIDNSENNVFQKIKELSYNKRMKHIVEVSKWTKSLEEKIESFSFEETDFQFIIYLIRQTENICNEYFEQIANLIINLCDNNLKLEDIEKNEFRKNEKLQSELDATKILKEGIENIKKKYSKIPFIGRKVLSVLSVKMLN